FVTYVTTVLMYVFLLVAIVDVALMWRGFKKVLAQRMPGTPTRGLLMYGMNRAIQIRRFRIPPPRVKRGEGYCLRAGPRPVGAPRARRDTKVDLVSALYRQLYDKL